MAAYLVSGKSAGAARGGVLDPAWVVLAQPPTARACGVAVGSGYRADRRAYQWRLAGGHSVVRIVVERQGADDGHVGPGLLAGGARRLCGLGRLCADSRKRRSSAVYLGPEMKRPPVRHNAAVFTPKSGRTGLQPHHQLRQGASHAGKIQ
ncbi:hypothetical protein HCH_04412 [Hahella chejuensis KCTC 2396]|uniref:Uncharacterized protein n=1 Tax=Hahella chejuensis (strain KCTC 2396) TaxID=349521 RepID=Q2SE08_HAHCH|nr:hypothetical protein HCH_04412 [Hahella chejuensis KCTC 2396]